MSTLYLQVSTLKINLIRRYFTFIDLKENKMNGFYFIFNDLLTLEYALRIVFFKGNK